MALLDSSGRRLDIKLVYWGPARGGKTTSLRSLHGSFTSDDRGEMQSVDTEEERTYFFDYAPIELPTFRGLSLRAHAYTVPGQETYVETRRRVLRGADGVIFVADASPGAIDATVASWKQLDECLKALEAGRTPLPVVLAVNKRDVPGAARGEAVARTLARAVPSRTPVELVETSAILGTGVLKGFRSVLVAAAEHAIPPDIRTPDGGDDRKRFLIDLSARVHRSDDGVPVADVARGHVATVPAADGGPDVAGVEAALAAAQRVGELEHTKGHLERAVAERTFALRHERESLERRVQERTRELEAAEQAALDTERRLLDRERAESMQRLAAGLAHEINNPVGAALANLEDAEQTLREALAGLEGGASEKVTDALGAVVDARHEIERVATSILSLFDGATSSRREAVKTPLAAVVRDALAAHKKVHPALAAPLVVEREGVLCGVPSGECARWLFRLLCVFGRSQACRRVEVDRVDAGPRVTVEAEGPPLTSASNELESIKREVERAGGHFEALPLGKRFVVRLVLPRAVGEALQTAPGSAT